MDGAGRQRDLAIQGDAMRRKCALAGGGKCTSISRRGDDDDDEDDDRPSHAVTTATARTAGTCPGWRSRSEGGCGLCVGVVERPAEWMRP